MAEDSGQSVLSSLETHILPLVDGLTDRLSRAFDYISRDLSEFDRTADPSSFDFVTTFDAIHDQAYPLNVLEGIHRTLADTGGYGMQDISGTGALERDVEHPLGTCCTQSPACIA